MQSLRSSSGAECCRSHIPVHFLGISPSWVVWACCKQALLQVSLRAAALAYCIRRKKLVLSLSVLKEQVLLGAGVCGEETAGLSVILKLNKSSPWYSGRTCGRSLIVFCLVSMLP